MVLAVDGRIVYVNRALWKTAGCTSADELLGRAPEALIIEGQRHLVRSQMVRALGGDGKGEPVEYRGLRVDGSTLPVEVLGRRITFRGRPALLAAVRDITVRDEAERARHRAETELRRVLRAVPDLIWSGNITECGVLRIRGSSSALASLTGRPSTSKYWNGERRQWLAIVHADDRRVSRNSRTS